MKQWKVTEWKSAGGDWHVAYTQEFTSDYSKWWFIARVLGVTLPEFVELLVNKYKVSNIEILHTVDGDMLYYTWDNDRYTFAHKFLLDVNRNARNKNVMC